MAGAQLIWTERVGPRGSVLMKEHTGTHPGGADCRDGEGAGKFHFLFLRGAVKGKGSFNHGKASAALVLTYGPEQYPAPLVLLTWMSAPSIPRFIAGHHRQDLVKKREGLERFYAAKYTVATEPEIRE